MDMKAHLHKLFYDENYLSQDRERHRKALERYKTDYDKCSILEETNSYYSNSSDRNCIEFSFSITCSCGETMTGIIRRRDKSDKLHCSCGLVWEVNKPYKEDEE